MSSRACFQSTENVMWPGVARETAEMRAWPKEVTTRFATHPKNHNLGKSLTTMAIVLEKKILHE